MKTYELCKSIRRIILTRTAEVYSYTNWDDTFALRQIRKIPESIINMKGVFKIDPNVLTSEEMDDLGFGKWSEENPIRLIPLWMYPFLVDTFEAGSIAGEPITVLERDKMDTDHRFGCLAYGVIPINEISD